MFLYVDDLKEYFESKFCKITDCVIIIDKNTSMIYTYIFIYINSRSS